MLSLHAKCSRPIGRWDNTLGSRREPRCRGKRAAEVSRTTAPSTSSVEEAADFCLPQARGDSQNTPVPSAQRVKDALDDVFRAVFCYSKRTKGEGGLAA